MLYNIYILSSATHSSFGLRRSQHLVSLHHAAVGEAAVVFIRIATPWERAVATASA